MKTSDFDYNLPENLIAQTPLKERATSKLLVLNRKTEELEDKHFSDILDYLNPGDALVLNETKVLPARIFGIKPETGGAVELLLLKDLGDDVWECLARPQKRLKPGTKIVFGAKKQSASVLKQSNSAIDLSSSGIENTENLAPLTATVIKTLPDGITHVKFLYSGVFLEILATLGTMPLPPYIHKQLKNQDRYQTVYAKNVGSSAAPTAGLHFTPELLQKIEKKGVKIVKITLHVGLGTFRPVQVDDVQSHQMHTESYEVTPEAAQTLTEVWQSGGRMFAVGTTSVRTLETVAKNHNGKIVADRGETDIFIYPGFKFQVIDGLITNFHLPKSTLLMLISAFCTPEDPKFAQNSAKNAPNLPLEASETLSGRDLILRAYQHAISENYRFFSFGDAMLII